MNDLEKVIEQGYAEARVRVRYAETDQMGVVYHANYLVWVEVGRVEFIRQLGMDYKDMEQEDGATFSFLLRNSRRCSIRAYRLTGLSQSPVNSPHARSFVESSSTYFGPSKAVNRWRILWPSTPPFSLTFS